MKMLNMTPDKDGFFMPAEFAEHEGTLMIYPTRPGSWGKDRSGALFSFGKIYTEIMKREKLYLAVSSEYYDEACEFLKALFPKTGLSADEFEKRKEVIAIDSDDAWARDVGPTFVVDDSGDVRGINWSFNAWGGEVDGLYATWDKDDALAVKFMEHAGYDYYDAEPFVLEGGSIHSDGEGTVMVTESCLLSEGRNPSLTKEEIEEKLKVYLGAEKILWLPRGIYNDETNEHVDNVCAFVAPGEVVLAWTDDKNDPQYDLSFASYEYLKGQKDAKGRDIVIRKLPIPEHTICITEKDLANYEFEGGEDFREVGERLAASYVNFYYINGAALVPMFGGENESSDKRALEVLKELCPGREVIGIPARDILLGGGNIHCITQQIPYRKKH